jgi:hypothetical protein
LVEHRIENAGVGGSSPPLAIFSHFTKTGAIAKMPRIPKPGVYPQISPMSMIQSDP